MVPAALLTSSLLCLASWALADTVYLEGNQTHGTTEVRDSAPVTVMSRGIHAQAPSTSSAVFRANADLAQFYRYLLVTFSGDSYINDTSATVAVYDGETQYSETLGQFGGVGFNGQLLAVVTSQEYLYISVVTKSPCPGDFYLQMTVTPIDTTALDLFNGNYYHLDTDVYDYENHTILSLGSSLLTIPASDYTTCYADSGLSSRHYFDVTFSGDSYIGPSADVVLFVRDGPNNDSQPLATFKGSTPLGSLSTSQRAVYVNVEVHAHSSRDYFIQMVLKPRQRDNGGSPSGLTIWLAGGASGFILLLSVTVTVVLRVIVTRRRRLIYRSARTVPAVANAYTDEPPVAVVAAAIVPPPVYPGNPEGGPAPPVAGEKPGPEVLSDPHRPSGSGTCEGAPGTPAPSAAASSTIPSGTGPPPPPTYGYDQ